MIRIRHEGCILCAGCASVCPTGALELVGNKIEYYPEKCINCGACVKVCPAAVITLDKVGK
ncbi:MAG: 4Fe-4S dicluster domain-containing protein [Candidatus Micrarchaeota archaeon]